MAVTISPGHTPLTVTAYLRTGVGLSAPYDLDLAGIIATQMRLREKAARHAAGELVTRPMPDTTEDTVYDMDLPISRCAAGAGQWHWAATSAIIGDIPVPAENHMFYKSLDSGWVYRAAERPLPYHHPYKGPYRDVMMNQPITMTNRLIWRTIGDEETLRELLTPIHFIGKRRTTGEGAILAWDITPTSPTDPNRWVHADGATILRPIPTSCAEHLNIDYDTTHHGIRPPVWHPDLLEELAITKDDDDDWFD